MEVETIVSHVGEKWVQDCDFPKSIYSEMGTTFEKGLVWGLCRLARVCRPFQPYLSLILPKKCHHSTRQVIQRYGFWTMPHQPLHLITVIFTYNTKIHHGMEQTPFEAFRGHPATISPDVIFPAPGERAGEESAQIQETMDRFEVFYRHLWMMF